MTTGVDSRAVVDPSARIGAGCELGPFCVVEADAVVGDGCVLEPFSRVCRGTVLGREVRLGQGAVVGGLAQVTGIVVGGTCQVGDKARIGEYATVHASKDQGCATLLEAGCMVMAYAHVAHDCRIGERAVLANAVQLAGHVEIGRGAFVGGGTLVHQFVNVGEHAFAAGGIRLERDLVPWSRAMGEPPRWAGPNTVGLRRSDGAPSVQEASEVLRILFRNGHSLDAAVGELTNFGSEAAKRLLAFLERSRRGLLRPRE